MEHTLYSKIEKLRRNYFAVYTVYMEKQPIAPNATFLLSLPNTNTNTTTTRTRTTQETIHMESLCTPRGQIKRVSDKIHHARFFPIRSWKNCQNNRIESLGAIPL